ncbi:MAG: metallophosphoesterase [Reichenbachiella sp.]|uniref:metallophosphoesterase n=1 Tax=Reichenbachiella sp. TaxID=2184521 RepID=UPI003267B7FF
MKIQYASDLHLEFPEQRAAINSKKLIPEGDILVLAGDICYLKEEHFKFGFFDYCSDHWRQTYIIPGNHEFYDHSYDIVNSINDFSIQVRENVQYLNNTCLEIDNVRILFSTLWTSINKRPLDIEHDLNDFHICTYQGRGFKVTDHNLCNYKSLAFLNDVLQKETDCSHNIVVSHHVPFSHTFCDYPFDPTLQEAFHTDLSGLMNSYQIDYWIYGHNHYNMSSFGIERTTLLTNQLGYVRSGENRKFNRAAVIEL